MRNGPRRRAALLAAALLTTATAAVAEPSRRNHMDTGEALAVLGVSAGLLAGGLGARRAWAPDAPRWTEPTGLDLWAARHLAPPASAGRRNFMQRDGAGFANVAGCGLLLAGADLAWPAGDRWRDTGQDQLLYWSGVAALTGVQQAVKGLVARQRPLARLHPDLAAARADADPRRDQRSFWSGHTSGAFFASTFLNLRLRDVMRRGMTDAEYRSWRWAPPTLMYGWATWVGWSRIQGCEHWLTDVLTGALAGWACAELFHALGEGAADGGTADGGGAGAPLFTIAVGF